MPRVLLAIVLLTFTSSASADPDLQAARARRAADPAPHAIYVDVLGKAGLWGIGYDWQFRRRFAVGAAASYASARPASQSSWPWATSTSRRAPRAPAPTASR
jgi:hypothetical protein